MISTQVRQILRLARPAVFLRELRRVVAKLRRRLSKIERRVVHLQPSPGTEPAGSALVAYIIDAVVEGVDDPQAPLPVTHTHFWETRQIVRTFLDLGFTVDVVHWTNRGFVPQEPYRVALDVRQLMPLWKEHLPEGCLRIFHGETSHAGFNDAAQERRHQAFEARHGFRLPERKAIGDTPAFALADAATLLGDENTVATYRDAVAGGGPKIWPVTISAPAVYPRLDRDFERCRTRFLWLGSEGLVHKGLDLALEAFAEMPGHHLTVCGPIHREREFERFYWRHLYDTPNIHTQGWVDVTSDDFVALCRDTLSMVYPTCSEGQCGSVVTCMHAGLAPLVSDRTGVPMDPSYSVVVPRPTVESIRSAVLELSSRSPDKLAAMSDGARDYARSHHTKEHFAANYRAAIEEILERGKP